MNISLAIFTANKLGGNSSEMKTVIALIRGGDLKTACTLAKTFSKEYASEDFEAMGVICESLEKGFSKEKTIERIAYYLTRHIDTGFEYAKERARKELFKEFNEAREFRLAE